MQHLVNEVKPKSTIKIYDLYLIYKSRITSVHLNSFNLPRSLSGVHLI